jgi:Cu/Zn superoxide dismutase
MLINEHPFFYITKKTVTTRYPGGDPPPTEAMFHLHQNGHHLPDHHQERKHVLESALAHQKDNRPHGSPWNKE